MSQALTTLGYVDGGGDGGGGGGGPSGTLIAFRLFDNDGNPASGVDLSGAGEVMLSVGGAAFAARVGDPPVSIANGDGDYYYELDDTEIPTPGSFVLLKVEKTGYHLVREERYYWATSTNVTTSTSTTANNIVNAVSALSSAIAAAITSINSNTTTGLDAVPTAAEIEAYFAGIHGAGSWAGATAAEILAAIVAYNHDGGVTLGGLFARIEAVLTGKTTGLNGPVARFYMRDGTTVAVEITIDPEAGTRGQSTVGGSEP